jgi:hypothetical protein
MATATVRSRAAGTGVCRGADCDGAVAARDACRWHIEVELANGARMQITGPADVSLVRDFDQRAAPAAERRTDAIVRIALERLLNQQRQAIEALVVAPLAVEAVKGIDALFDIEREINGRSIEQRLAVRRERVAPLVADLEAWMRAQRAKLSRHSDVGKAMDYMLKRWETFSRFLDDGRICLTNNAAERALRGIALDRKSWLFASSDRGGERAAVMYTLIQSLRLNGVDPQAWLRRRAHPHQ